MTAARDVADVIARQLVDRPDAVVVSESEDRGGVDIEVRTAEGDLGRLIGRQGRTAGAIRTLVEVAAQGEGHRATVEFVDD